MKYLKIIILWSFFLIPTIQCMDSIQYITELDEHKSILKKALKKATENVIIVSPYISINAVIDNNTPSHIEEAQRRGVKVTIYTDLEFDIGKEYAERGRKVLRNLLCDLHIVKKVHAKTLIVDNSWIVTGSFNWLSAARDKNSVFSRVEHSILVKGDEANGCIEKAVQSIEALEENIDHPYKKFYDKYIGYFFSLRDNDDISTWYLHYGDYLKPSFKESVEIHEVLLKTNKHKLCGRCKEVCDNSDRECGYCDATEFSSQESENSASEESLPSIEELRSLLYEQIEGLYKKHFNLG